MIPPQKQMTGMLGHPVAENPIDRMFDAVYAHHGLNWQFWKNNIADEAALAKAVAGLVPLGYSGACITVPYKVAVIPLLDAVDDDVRAIGAANYMTIERSSDRPHKRRQGRRQGDREGGAVEGAAGGDARRRRRRPRHGGGTGLGRCRGDDAGDPPRSPGP
ncbi:MAG: hypothetical protein ACKO5M_11710 [Vulcanococcus sp.]